MSAPDWFFFALMCLVILASIAFAILFWIYRE